MRVCLNWSNANLVYVRSQPGDTHILYDARYAYTSGSASVSVSDQTALLHAPIYIEGSGPGPGPDGCPMPMRVSCVNAALRKTRSVNYV